VTLLELEGAVDPPARVLLVAGPAVLVQDVSAWWLVQQLKRAPAMDLTGLTVEQKAQIRATHEGLLVVAEDWLPREALRRKRLARVDGSAEGVGTEAAASFLADAISTEEAAAMLGVTESRVRQRARCGELGASKPRGRWLVSRVAVLAELELKASA
jgi:excisionase family DNA binding protein